MILQTANFLPSTSFTFKIGYRFFYLPFGYYEKIDRKRKKFSTIFISDDEFLLFIFIYFFFVLLRLIKFVVTLVIFSD